MQWKLAMHLILIMAMSTPILAASLPNEQEIKGVRNVCALGETREFEAKIELELLKWRKTNLGSNIDAKVATKEVGAILEKITDKQSGVEIYKIYTTCVINAIEKYLNAPSQTSKKARLEATNNSIKELDAKIKKHEALAKILDLEERRRKLRRAKQILNDEYPDSTDYPPGKEKARIGDALTRAGIDPLTSSDVWGLPFGTLGVAFSLRRNVDAYIIELGTEIDNLRMQYQIPDSLSMTTGEARDVINQCRIEKIKYENERNVLIAESNQ